jgi:uncharacterized protein (TIGR00290 family)
VLHSGRDEEHGAGHRRVAFGSGSKRGPAAHDVVDFVLGVRFLRVRDPRAQPVDPDAQVRHAQKLPIGLTRTREFRDRIAPREGARGFRHAARRRAALSSPWFGPGGLGRDPVGDCDSTERADLTREALPGVRLAVPGALGPEEVASSRRAVLAWGGGKDSAFALHELRNSPELEVVGLVTTVSASSSRVSAHGVRIELVDAQARALRLPCRTVALPTPCPNDAYEREMARALEAERAQGVERIVFGDLFLEDIRAYRERHLEAVGVPPVFPLWGRDTHRLAAEILDSGFRASLVCVDTRRLPRRLAGREFDRSLLAELPPGVDPCGENGEFHTFVFDGPNFRERVRTVPGPITERDGFAYADLLPR